MQAIKEAGTAQRVLPIDPDLTQGGHFFTPRLVGEDREVGLAVMRALVRTQQQAILGAFLFGLGPLVMGIVALIEGIIYLVKTDEDFQRVYVDGRRAWF